jgi:hypothetical protein
MFSTVASTPHSIRKRMLSHVYSKSFLQSSPTLQGIANVLLNTRLFTILEGYAESGEEVNVLELNFASMMDFMNAYVYGLSASGNFLQDIPLRKHFFDLYQSRKGHTFWPQELPRLTAFLGTLGIRLVPRWVDEANRELEQRCLDANRATASSTASVERGSPDYPVVYSQLSTSLRNSDRENLSGPSTPLELAIASELFDHRAAGHETAGITLTYLMHELSLQPALQALLRRELLTLEPSLAYPSSGPSPSIPAPRDIDGLPLLHAVVTETLRLHAAIPGPQPRITPAGPCTLAGHADIPPGTRVSAQAYTLHRNPRVFPEPEGWRPQRWLEASADERAEMMRWFWAFGSGGRMCIGSNFAMQRECGAPASPRPRI